MDAAYRADDGRSRYGPACLFTIDRPVMTQRWERLTFVHWSFEPDAVQILLPEGLRVDTHGGTAWVGLVPFFMRVATAGGRGLGWASDFLETNVRTYVVDREGRRGIWFFSLDAARLGAVVVARATYRLPYFWSSMALVEDGGEIAYDCRRRGPGSAGPAGSTVTSRVRIGIGPEYGADELADRDHFLTARWILFSAVGSRHRFARAWHEPWPLRRAEIRTLDDSLLLAAGLPRPEGEPLAHYSPGVDVRIGRPEHYGSAPARQRFVRRTSGPRRSGLSRDRRR